MPNQDDDSASRVRLEIHIFQQPDPRMDEVLGLLKIIARKEDQMAKTLADVAADETAEGIDIATLIAHYDAIQVSLADLQPTQAAIDGLAATVAANRTLLASRAQAAGIVVPPAPVTA